MPKIRIYVQSKLQSNHQHLRPRGQTQTVFRPSDDAGLLGDVDRQRATGKEYFARENMAQLLASRQVEIMRVPNFKEELTVTTSVYGMKPMFGFRNTFIYDAEGKPCYRTWSMGAFVDKANGKLKRVDDAVASSLLIEPQLEMNYKDRRIILPKEGGKTFAPIQVMRADIDYNRHVNNANYIRMAMELLPEDFVVKGLRVEYRVAAKLGDNLTPTLFEIENGFVISLAISNEASAIVEFTR